VSNEVTVRAEDVGVNCRKTPPVPLLVAVAVLRVPGPDGHGVPVGVGLATGLGLGVATGLGVTPGEGVGVGHEPPPAVVSLNCAADIDPVSPAALSVNRSVHVPFRLATPAKAAVITVGGEKLAAACGPAAVVR